MNCCTISEYGCLTISRPYYLLEKQNANGGMQIVIFQVENDICRTIICGSASCGWKNGLFLEELVGMTICIAKAMAVTPWH
ncbi:hypothetical protein CsSME_00028829 [Camellia sinensis var. sinensis]